MYLFFILTLQEEIGIFEAELQQCGNVVYRHESSVMQLCVLLQPELIMEMAGFLGMYVKSAFTSYDVMSSPSSSLMVLNLVHKCLCVPPLPPLVSCKYNPGFVLLKFL